MKATSRAGVAVTTPLRSASSGVLDLGVLSRAVVVARPSKSVKSPYVADVLLLDGITFGVAEETWIRAALEKTPKKKKEIDEHKARLHGLLTGLGPDLKLAHAPSLDCAGIVIPGTQVLLAPSTSVTAKTAYTIYLCEEIREEGYVTVGYHPALAERFCKECYLSTVRGVMSVISSPLDQDEELVLTSQRTFGDSRFDFVLESSKRIVVIEVKNVVGADYTIGSVPLARSPVGVYTVPPSSTRKAIFPHGTNTKPGLPCISDRAIKHLHSLTNLHGTHIDGKIVECAVVFMVNRADCDAFRPCHEADPLFAQVLKKAARKIKVVAQELVWEASSANAYTCRAGRELPCVFDPSVDDTKIDAEVLQSVLDFNAADKTSGYGKKRKAERSKK